MNVRKPSLFEIEQAETWDTWEKDVSDFDWHYAENETCYILEGAAKVVDMNGNSIEFSAGDWVSFPKGLKCRWSVSAPIKKKYLFY